MNSMNISVLKNLFSPLKNPTVMAKTLPNHVEYFNAFQFEIKQKNIETFCTDPPSLIHIS